MTLKLTRFLTDIMNKQASISHFESDIQVGKPETLRQEVKNQIFKIFGKLFLEDANFVVLTTVTPNDSNDKTRLIKKFADLVGTVFETEVVKTEVKSFDIESENISEAEAPEEIEDYGDDDSEDEEDKTTNVPNLTTVFLIKVTTK